MNIEVNKPGGLPTSGSSDVPVGPGIKGPEGRGVLAVPTPSREVIALRPSLAGASSIVTDDISTHGVTRGRSDHGNGESQRQESIALRDNPKGRQQAEDRSSEISDVIASPVLSDTVVSEFRTTVTDVQTNLPRAQGVTSLPDRQSDGITDPGQVAERTSAVLSDFHSQSGIKIMSWLNDDAEEIKFRIDAPKKTDMTDEEIIAWKIRGGTPASYFEGEDRKSRLLMSKLSYDRTLEYIRFTGVTSRDMEKVKTGFPNLDDLLEKNTGSTVVLGSGLSELQIYLAEMYAQGKLAEPPVICDLFDDYRVLQGDFEDLQDRFMEAGLDFPFSLELSRTTGIADAVESGDLVAINYIVGTEYKTLPQELMNASLLINIFGPSVRYGLSSLEEQLSMLKLYGDFLCADTRIGIDMPELLGSRTNFSIEDFSSEVPNHVVWVKKTGEIDENKIRPKSEPLPLKKGKF